MLPEPRLRPGEGLCRELPLTETSFSVRWRNSNTQPVQRGMRKVTTKVNSIPDFVRNLGVTERRLEHETSFGSLSLFHIEDAGLW
jgi:hypothetical protein